MTITTPVSRVVGACLLDAREGRMMLPEQPAELLGTDPRTLLALEDGRLEISPRALTELTTLYRFGHAQALERLLAGRPDWNGKVRDREPGHAQRLAACARSSGRVRWWSTVYLPTPLQTRDYARAMGETSPTGHGAPRPAVRNTVYVLDAAVIQHGGATPRLMAEQLDHLLSLLDSGTDIRVAPGAHVDPQPPLHVVDLALPAGRVLAWPDREGVDYCATGRPAFHIDAALAGTDPRSSRDALVRAADSHRARTALSPAAPAPTESPADVH
ncbi:Scr1 family TA system antitoxin-like transcriptional regulator [Streptomyces anulatus]|uniref:Scr1 family TA system antitoxin-like transcriptional regulator n=1 Tax=Streptomyces anulatus TaxID=1892 RepID=UPI001C274352|nr:Scr1 family TA system antitoxin-like transcriptional regulator [Streptomyces anulatus]